MSRSKTPAPIADDGEATVGDLNRFQFDCLVAVDLVDHSDDEANGMAIADELAGMRDEKIYNGRIYPNLERLSEAGLITSQSADGRANVHSLTEQGRALVAERVEQIDTALGGEE